METARPIAVYGISDGLGASQVFRLFEDSRDHIWVSTTSSATSGLARWEPVLGRFRDLAGSPGLPSLKDDLARSFSEDRGGSVWIGFNTGLVRYANGKFQFFSEKDGLPPGAILDIHVDRSNRIWLASRDGGLVRVDQPEDVHPRFVSYTKAEGWLSSNNVEVIGEDASGLLYVGGGSGLDRFEPDTGRVKHFGSAEGLPPGQLRTAFRDRHGALWFGMTNGLARLVPATISRRAPPSILITGLRVGGIPRSLSALGEREMSLADLSAHENQLQIDFVAPGFGPGEVLRYQYRLDGADSNWSTLGDQRTVTYASLASGRYTFAARAVNSDGIVSPQTASIAFTILRPVWQRWWFVTLAMIVLGLTVHALYRRRVARLLEIANMRTHIATDLHDDIGANLTRIALLSEMAKQTRGEASLTSIARIARESVSSMNDIVWAINPRRETLLELTRRMRQHAEEVFTLRDIAVRFNAPDSADSPKLGMDVRRDLLLIFKEAVNNAARHSGCSAVDIELRVAGSRLVLIVADNGAGFDASRESDGQGLMSLQRRARRLGGTLDVTSSPGSGTRVTVNAPI
jgi:signal transduction histidine kinase